LPVTVEPKVRQKDPYSLVGVQTGYVLGDEVL
jgi:hypothetical protein